jgi:pseudaminic acid cytidylyltransferase
VNTVAVIPARGGSKRIPHKNTRLFCGQPIISYPLKAALNCGVFTRVIVSTDDPCAASIALELGADVVQRPKALADDFSSLRDVMVHEATQLSTPGGPDYLCFILATAVFVSESLLRRGAQIMSDGRFEHALTALPFSSPVQRAFVQTHSGGTRMLMPEYYLCRSQDLSVTYRDAGQCYWGKTTSFLKTSAEYFSESTTLIPMDPDVVVDIDTLDDWRKAERCHRAAHEH